jgi:hypothetical protein
VLNVTAHKWKIKVTFVLSVIIAPMVAFYLLYKYSEKHKYLSSQASASQDFDDAAIASYSV